jgi:hypothetical protein
MAANTSQRKGLSYLGNTWAGHDCFFMMVHPNLSRKDRFPAPDLLNNDGGVRSVRALYSTMQSELHSLRPKPRRTSRLSYGWLETSRHNNIRWQTTSANTSDIYINKGSRDNSDRRITLETRLYPSSSSCITRWAIP